MEYDLKEQGVPDEDVRKILATLAGMDITLL
jgi:hypothetical protein